MLQTDSPSTNQFRPERIDSTQQSPPRPCHLSDGWVHEKRRRAGKHLIVNVTRNVTRSGIKSRASAPPEGQTQYARSNLPLVCHCSRRRSNHSLHGGRGARRWQTDDGRQDARNQHSGVTLDFLCAWGQDKGWQLSDGGSAFVRPGRSPGVGRTHSCHSTSDSLTPFAPTHLVPLSDAGQKAARGC